MLIVTQFSFQCLIVHLVGLDMFLHKVVYLTNHQWNCEFAFGFLFIIFILKAKVMKGSNTFSIENLITLKEH